ncbi:MAG: tetratricopeptide repeat protein [Candidatus Omnitrophica bacterium]|nr:tetratricopeptide repeat protein [Candidatus Omnitrophota bacterium]
MIKVIRSNHLAIIILSLLGIAVYSNTLNNTFHFDDFSFILDNPGLSDPGKLTELFKYWPSRFIGFLSFAVNYQIHQFSVFGYHLVNIGLHILTSFLVFWLACLTFSFPAMKEEAAYSHRELMGFFTAAIFLTHPVQTEALNYIFQRVTILSAFFYLTSLCLYAKAMLALREGGRVNKFCYSASLIAAFIGMFTKENIVTLPLMILLYDLYFLQGARGPRWRRLFPFLLLLPVVPLTVAIAKPVIFADVERLLNNPLSSSSHYLWTQFSVLTTYLRLFLFPAGLNLDYDYPVARAFWGISTLAGFSVLLFLIITSILAFRRYRLMSFGILWFILTMLPESSIIPIADPIYEHRLYLPLVGCSIFAVAGLYYLFRNKSFKIVITILTMIVAVCSILTYGRNRVWENEIVLWSDTISKSPEKLRPYNNRGLAYFDQGEYDKAIADFSRAIGLKRDYADGYYNRGLAYHKKGEYNKAAADYTEAIKINPEYLKSYINRGQVYNVSGEHEKAILDFRRAIEIAPLNTEGYFNLAYIYLVLGKKEEAAAVYNKILAIYPNNAEVNYNLGIIKGKRPGRKKKPENSLRDHGVR